MAKCIKITAQGFLFFFQLPVELMSWMPVIPSNLHGDWLLEKAWKGTVEWYETVTDKRELRG